jgi:dipeptidyl-peptidase-4
MGSELPLQWLANQGFVVVRLDGRGTPGRGREWERAISHDLATIPAQDQIAGLKALGARFAEMDMARIGAYGWSFGGYMAALLAMKHGDVVKYGVAGAPVSDWLDYDTHYTERYLGVPNGPSPAYEVSSLLTYAKDAKGGLLLIHGTADDNVYFSHTLKLSDALFRAGKAHEVLPVANLTHMVPEPLIMQRQWERIARAFKEHL